MALEALPWWADPTSPQNLWTQDYSRTLNPTGIVSPDDPNYNYQNWLQQNFDTSRFFSPTSTPVQTRYGGEELTTNTYTPPRPAASTTASGTVGGTYPTSTQLSGTNNVNYTTGSADTTTPPTGDVWDGFARRYVPGQRDMLFGKNSPVLGDYLNQDGRTNYSNLQGDMQRYADIAPRLYESLVGGNMKGKTQADDTIINWMVDLFDNQSHVGGASPTSQQIMNQLFAGFNDKTSSLGSQLYDPSTGNPVGTDAQIQAVMSYLPLAGEFNNSSYATALYGQAQRLAQEYRSKVSKGEGDGQTFVQFLQDNLLQR